MGLFTRKEQTDVIEVNTQKNLSEISNILRTFAEELKAGVRRLSYADDPLGDFDNGPDPSIAVQIGGGVGLFGPKELPFTLMYKNASNYWTFDVEVYDIGSTRMVLIMISNIWGDKKSNYKYKDLLVELLNQ